MSGDQLAEEDRGKFCFSLKAAFQAEPGLFLWYAPKGQQLHCSYVPVTATLLHPNACCLEIFADSRITWAGCAPPTGPAGTLRSSEPPTKGAGHQAGHCPAPTCMLQRRLPEQDSPSCMLASGCKKDLTPLSFPLTSQKACCTALSEEQHHSVLFCNTARFPKCLGKKNLTEPPPTVAALEKRELSFKF